MYKTHFTHEQCSCPSCRGRNSKVEVLLIYWSCSRPPPSSVGGVWVVPTQTTIHTNCGQQLVQESPRCDWTDLSPHDIIITSPHTHRIASVVVHRLHSCCFQWLISSCFHYWCSVCVRHRNLADCAAAARREEGGEDGSNDGRRQIRKGSAEERKVVGRKSCSSLFTLQTECVTLSDWDSSWNLVAGSKTFCWVNPNIR